MDLVLELCDHYFLDKVWAKVLPASAFLQPLPSSTIFKSAVESPSLWSNVVSKIPHPPLPVLNQTVLSASQLSSAYATVSAWPRDYVPRQLVSLTVLTLIGVHIMYFLFAWLSYQFIFDHRMMKHPRFLKNQVRLEIETRVKAFPGMMLLTLPWFQAEVMGYSRLYKDVNEYGWGYFVFSIFL